MSGKAAWTDNQLNEELRLRGIKSIGVAQLRIAALLWQSMSPLDQARKQGAVQLDKVRSAATQLLDAIGAMGIEADCLMAESASPGVRNLCDIAGKGRADFPDLIGMIGQLQKLEKACAHGVFVQSGGRGPGRGAGEASHVIKHLAAMIEAGGGKPDATPGGELVQAFGIAADLAGVTFKDEQRTVRAALADRSVSSKKTGDNSR